MFVNKFFSAKTVFILFVQNWYNITLDTNFMYLEPEHWVTSDNNVLSTEFVIFLCKFIVVNLDFQILNFYIELLRNFHTHCFLLFAKWADVNLLRFLIYLKPFYLEMQANWLLGLLTTKIISV